MQIKRQLRRELRWRIRFAPAREAEFVRASAARCQRLIRHTFPLAGLIFIAYAIGDNWLFQRLHDPVVAASLAFVAMSTTAVGAWGWVARDPMRVRLTVELVLIAGGAALAVAVARASAIGESEPYGMMAWHLVYVCFLSGLLTRATFGISLVTIAGYLGAKLWFADIGPWEVERLGSLAVLVLLGVLGSRIQEVTRREGWLLRQDLAHKADHDELTGLQNRRSFFAEAARRLAQARRENKPVSLILLDIDYFKRLNDSRGHLVGDRCLRRVAEVTATAAARPLDLAARFGGEEFVVLLYDCPEVEATRRAEALRRAIEEQAMRHPRTRSGRLTASLGVCGRVPGREDTPESLLAEVDARLYAAKRAGRNQVCAGPTDPFTAPPQTAGGAAPRFP